MVRAVALVGIFLAYRIADRVCQGFADADALRAWIPPVVLWLGCAIGARSILPPRMTGSVRWLWAVRLGVATLGGVVAAFGLLVPPSPTRFDPSPLDTLPLLSVVPFAEEFFFRGVMLAFLRERLGTFWAVVVVSVLFAVAHVPFGAPGPMFVLSLLCCGAALAGRSVLWAVAVHALWNGWVVVHHLSADQARIGVAAAMGIMAVGLAAAVPLVRWREA
jgi:membrane protease YdiL (CAAX protease family)